MNTDKKPKPSKAEGHRMTYGDLLLATVGKLDRNAKRSAPTSGTPNSLGGRLGALHDLADGKEK